MNSKHTPNKAGSKKGGSGGGESRGGQRGAQAARDKKKNTCCVSGDRGCDVGPSIVQTESEWGSQAPEQRAPWWRGQSPTQGQSLWCHEAQWGEETRSDQTSDRQETVQEGQWRRQKENSTSRSDTRAVANYNQIPEGRRQQERPSTTKQHHS